MLPSAPTRTDRLNSGAISRVDFQRVELQRAQFESDLLSALASLGYYGRRRDFFESEFIAALKLIDQGVPAAELSAAGYGDVDPVAGNDKPEDRTRNRRIEFTLMPSADDLVVPPTW